MRNIIFIFFGLTLFCCSTPAERSADKALDSLVDSEVVIDEADDFDYERLFKLESYLTSENIDTSEIQTIDFDCAILIYPTDEQRDEIIKEEGEEDFFIIADDNNWYQAQAIQMIDSVGVKKEAALRPYIKFVGSNKATWTLNVRKKDLPAWNIIFFKIGKEPLIIQSIDLTTERVRDYFEVVL